MVNCPMMEDSKQTLSMQQLTVAAKALPEDITPEAAFIKGAEFIIRFLNTQL